MGAPVVFFEFAGPEGQLLQEFYRTVFDWQIGGAPFPNYAYVDTGANTEVRGGIRQDPPATVIYVGVPSVSAALHAVEAAGGTVVLPETDVPGVITFGLMKDPAGNVVGLVKRGVPPR